MSRFALCLVYAVPCLGAVPTLAHATTIVNISAASGENGGSPVDQQGSLIDPVQLTLGAGTYRISDAYDPTTGYQSGAKFDAWNYQGGAATTWAWDYKVFRDDGSEGSTIGSTLSYASSLIGHVGTGTSFGTEAAAAAAGAALAPFTFTLTSATTLDFTLNDYYTPDNLGGISLAINSVSGSVSGVPLPASAPLFGAALVALGAVGYGLKRKGAASA